MKFKLSILVFLAAFSVSYAQDSEATVNQTFTRNADRAFVLVTSNNAQNFGAYYYKNPRRRVDGSFYLFDTFDNDAVIYLKSGQRLLLKGNINLNIERNTFVSKIANDSLYSFGNNNVEKIIVGKRVFKHVFSDGGGRTYEVIFEDPKFTILKGFDVRFVTGSANPMLARSNDRYVRNETYYVLQDNSLNKFALKKKKILKLLEADQERKTKFEQQMQEFKFSYRKVDDVIRALRLTQK